MKVVVDTNILLSSLLVTQSRLRDILLESEHQFYAPNYLFVELFKYKTKIEKYGKLDDEMLYTLLQLIIEKIHFVPTDMIAVAHRQKAYDLCKAVDVKVGFPHQNYFCHVERSETSYNEWFARFFASLRMTNLFF